MKSLQHTLNVTPWINELFARGAIVFADPLLDPPPVDPPLPHQQIDSKTIDTLIEAELPRVRICALKLIRKMPYDVGQRLFDDLVSEGTLGLVSCAARYDGRTSFGTFASWRIYGAMQDYLRRIDLLDKRERREDCTLERKEVGLEAAAHVCSENPWRKLEDSIDAKRVTAKLLATIDTKSRTAVKLRYFKEFSNPEIGRATGTSESMASYTVTKALSAMRKAA